MLHLQNRKLCYIPQPLKIGITNIVASNRLFLKKHSAFVFQLLQYLLLKLWSLTLSFFSLLSIKKCFSILSLSALFYFSAFSNSIWLVTDLATKTSILYLFFCTWSLKIASVLLSGPSTKGKESEIHQEKIALNLARLGWQKGWNSFPLLPTQSAPLQAKLHYCLGQHAIHTIKTLNHENS